MKPPNLLPGLHNARMVGVGVVPGYIDYGPTALPSIDCYMSQKPFSNLFIKRFETALAVLVKDAACCVAMYQHRPATTALHIQ
jgi:hypothetical protein